MGVGQGVNLLLKVHQYVVGPGEQLRRVFPAVHSDGETMPCVLCQWDTHQLESCLYF